MRILTLDYLPNVPGSGKHIKGGAERFARDFSAYATKEGHEWVGVLQHSERERPLIQELPGSAGKRFFSIFSRNAGSEHMSTFASVAEAEVAYEPEVNEMAEVMRLTKPEVVFLNGFIPFSWMLFLAARRERVPVVIQHAGIFAIETAAYADVYPLGYRTLAKQMEREVSEQSVANIFLNEHSRSAFLAHVPVTALPNPRIVRLPHAGWSFPKKFAPTPQKERVIGVVSRWDRIKNHDAVLALAEEIYLQKLPWKLVSVMHLPDTGQKIAFKARYRERIEIVSPMGRDALRDFYRSLDVLILPSHFETVGGVVMEALAEGKPTLVSPGVGWIDEYKKSQMIDWVIDFSDPKKVIERLTDMFSRTTWPELATFAEYVQLAHDPYTIYAEYLELFNEIILTHIKK